ncbi:MAG: secondary thiamine-phosphate synthase enzyme YjbQ [bacterium]
MKVVLEKLKVQTRRSEEAINITPEVEKVVTESGVQDGLVNVMTLHTSSGLTVTEGIPCLEEDIMDYLARIVPEEDNYHHRRYLDFDGRLGFNADAHIKSVLAGMNAMFAVQGGKLVKGSRQTIYFLEFDGPLERSYCVQILGV